MLATDADFARSVVAVVDFVALQALAGSRHAGVVAACSDREGPPGAICRRLSFGRLQPVIDKLDGAADLGLREWHMKEPLDFPRDFRLREKVSMINGLVSVVLSG
jgi:hypothetical protein